MLLQWTFEGFTCRRKIAAHTNVWVWMWVQWGILVCSQMSFPKYHYFFFIPVKKKTVIQSSSVNIRPDHFLSGHFFFLKTDKHIYQDELFSPLIFSSYSLFLSFSGTSWASWTSRNWCKYKKNVISLFNLNPRPLFCQRTDWLSTTEYSPLRLS